MIFNPTTGGGSGGTLTVTAPMGVTAAVSKNGVTRSKTVDSSGTAVFKGLEAGTWTITISDGSETATATVEIVADYAKTMTFFAATIAVTFPEGSTCTCSDGNTTLTAPTTSGSYTFTVPNAGDWTVSCTDSEGADSRTVTITADGESQSVELSYDLLLYDAGNTYDATTGGWFGKAYTSNGWASIGSSSIVFGYSQVSQAWSAAGTKSAIDLTKYSTLNFDMEVSSHYNSAGGTAVVGVTSNPVTVAVTGSGTGGAGNTFTAYKCPTVDGTRRTVSVDISSIETGYVSIHGIMNAIIYKVWAE